MTQENPSVMTAGIVPCVRKMKEVACVVGEDDPLSLGGNTQLKVVGSAKMARIPCCQAIDAMLSQHRCQGDRYGFVDIEFHNMAGVNGGQLPCSPGSRAAYSAISLSISSRLS